MENDSIAESIRIAVDDVLQNSSSQKKIQNLIDKHNEKIHFIPKRYRILGGLLQSMNIQFGNFLEKTITNLVSLDQRNEIITDLSGKKNVGCIASKGSFEMVDKYIDECQINQGNDQSRLRENFYNLLKGIIAEEKRTPQSEKVKSEHDIDLLFTHNKKIIYTEIKYNDDHDTGKFVDINRKILKTYAMLANEYKIDNTDELVPILMFFNNKRLKINPFLPEDVAIYRGERFFRAFTNVSYEEIDRLFSTISESEEIQDKFDRLAEEILKGS